jgi:hypothetical protein
MSRWRKRSVGALIVVAVLGSFARAAQAGNQVLVLAKERTAFSARVRAEIDAMGFETVSSGELDGRPPFLPVAIAKVIETPPPRRVELWLPAANGGQLELSAVIETSAGEDEASQTVRASEELRAFFQPLRERARATEPPRESVLPPPPPPPQRLAPAAPPRVVVRTLRPLPQRFSAQVALGVPLEPGGPGGDVVIRGHWLFKRRLGWGAVLVVPILGSTVQATNGTNNTAAIWATLAGTELSMLLFDGQSAKLLTRGGIAVASVRAVGDATNPYSDKTDTAWVALPFVGAEVAVRLSERFQLSLGADIGDAFPEMQVVFSKQTIARWGRPFGLLSGGFRFGF